MFTIDFIEFCKKNAKRKTIIDYLLSYFGGYVNSFYLNSTQIDDDIERITHGIGANGLYDDELIDFLAKKENWSDEFVADCKNLNLIDWLAKYEQNEFSWLEKRAQDFGMEIYEFEGE